MRVHFISEKAGCNYLFKAERMLCQQPPDKEDLFVFTGSGDDIFYINKITDPETGKSRYPEIMFAHPFTEREIIDRDIYKLFCMVREIFKPHNIYFFICPPHEREKINAWVEKRLTFKEEAAVSLTEAEENLIDSISKGLNLTQTMRYDFKRISLNKKIRDDGLDEILSAYVGVRANGKRERSAIYDEIRAKLNQIDY